MAAIYSEKSLIEVFEDEGYSSAICPTTSDQDYINKVTIGDITWLIVMDGHGHHFEQIDKEDLVTWLKNYDWMQFLNNINEENPVNKLEDEIENNYDSTSGIGATLTLVRITENKTITVWWRGDSYVKIFEDDEFVGGSELISITMEKEKNRFKKEKIKYTLEKSWKPKVLSETKITMEPSFYINMTTKTSKLANKINMSQCLGHDGICGKSDNRNDYILDPNKNYRIVGASDGLWDVLMEKDNEHLVNRNNKAKDLVNIAYERWEQEWNYTWKGESFGEQKLDRRDDICCIVYDL
jgi:serine/threonine protein phosphatase PrpC